MSRGFVVTLVGGHFDGETVTVHEGNRIRREGPAGEVFVYTGALRSFASWKLDMEASAVATILAERRRRERQGLIP